MPRPLSGRGTAYVSGLRERNAEGPGEEPGAEDAELLGHMVLPPSTVAARPLSLADRHGQAGKRSRLGCFLDQIPVQVLLGQRSVVTSGDRADRTGDQKTSRGFCRWNDSRSRHRQLRDEAPRRANRHRDRSGSGPAVAWLANGSGAVIRRERPAGARVPEGSGAKLPVRDNPPLSQLRMERIGEIVLGHLPWPTSFLSAIPPTVHELKRDAINAVHQRGDYQALSTV